MSETNGLITNGSGKIPPARDGKKRQYSLEFKKELVARVKKGESVSEVSATTNVGEGQIRNWVKGEALGTFNKKKISGKRKYKAVDESAAKYIQLPAPLKDAMRFLKYAEQSMYQALRDNKIAKFDEAHDLSRMALRELEKLQDK